MRTRAQANRDAALRRLTRINRALAAGAVISVGVLTDVVANTVHFNKTSTGSAASEALAAQKTPARRAHTASRNAAITPAAQTSGVGGGGSAGGSPAGSSGGSQSGGASGGSSSVVSAPPPVSAPQPVVVVSGGS